VFIFFLLFLSYFPNNFTFLLNELIKHLWFNFTLCLPFVIVRQKGGVFFGFIWCLDQQLFPNRSSVFVPEWPKGEFVSIFIGYILVKTKTLFVMVAF
jgi:uncharacterized membrane protein YpjA